MKRLRLTSLGFVFLCLCLTLITPPSTEAKSFLVFQISQGTGSTYGRGKTSALPKTSDTLLWIVELDRITTRGQDGFNEIATDIGDPGSDRFLRVNDKSKTIYYNLNGGNGPYLWNRLIYGRSNSGKDWKFTMLVQQVDGKNDDGTHDNSAGFSITPCVLWPYKGQSIGISGYYPLTMNLRLCRLDGGADANDRVAKDWTFSGKLLPELTRQLNLQNKSDKEQAQDWILNGYYLTQKGYQRIADVAD